MSRLKKLVITTGDSDGIGFEVAAKALYKIGPIKNIRFFLFISDSHNSQNCDRYTKILLKKFNLLYFNSLESALSFEDQSSSGFRNLFIISSSVNPAIWVEIAARFCLKGLISGLVTGPLSKPGIKKSGLNDLGHTDILKRVCKTKNAYMAFLGNQFNVVLACGHVPISKIEKTLSRNTLNQVFINANLLQQYLLGSKINNPIAAVGLNPHAGDRGLIGRFEQNRLLPAIRSLRDRGIKISDPLVPDVAFQAANTKKFSVYVSMYHDQGLIPFKMAHGFAGAHLTLGLPIWRTSVDHGTAKDLFGLNKANPASMIEAIRWSMKLTKPV